MKIYLTGFMGAGKSFIAEKLAKELNIKCVDLDERIEKKYDMKIANVFQKYGEPSFRLTERVVLEEVVKEKGDMVVACGGGCLSFDENYKLVEKDNVVFIDTSFEACRIRIGKGHNRPLSLTNEDELKKLYDNRKKMYKKNSNIKVDGDKELDEIIIDIKKALKIK